MSDDDLRGLDIDALFAGPLDRIERVKRTCVEAIDQREQRAAAQ